MLWSKSHKTSQNNAESHRENASSAPSQERHTWGVIIIQFDSMVEPPTGVSLNQDRIPTCPTCLRWIDMWHHLFYGQDFYCSHLLWATSQATMFEDDFLHFCPFFLVFHSFFSDKVATFHRWLWVAEEPLVAGLLTMLGSPWRWGWKRYVIVCE